MLLDRPRENMALSKGLSPKLQRRRLRFEDTLWRDRCEIELGVEVQLDMQGLGGRHRVDGNSKGVSIVGRLFEGLCQPDYGDNNYL